ncbi:peptidase m14 carboxypeptidase a [Flammeovirgaceae bacterium 311]|nr:peptidase m14 carboxypeptidase a [Flammeovirgaceae bacterium 311]
MLKKTFKYLFLFCAAAFLFLQANAQKQDLSYYLPEHVQLNPAIPTPDSILGWQVGEWHVSHDKLVEYMRVLAQASDRIQIQTTGYTHERRPLILLTITHPANQPRLQEIRQKRQQLVNNPQSISDAELAGLPAVSYMGFSIHGNEASGSNAALLTAYYLAAAQGPEIEQMLQDVVVLLDPAFNPDGLQRFSSWVNAHKSKNEVADPQSRELNEAWPRGRTNHYWFDLNRDWLPVQQPESQARLKIFHEWKPNVLTDHHEMGAGSTFFFQPGVPSRNNPITPVATYELTKAIAQYHVTALDAIGSLYYSEEDFDDFFYGKGSTYPDVNGAVGILFEQASSRGHAQESNHGILRFPFTIRNQFTTTLSTLKATHELRQRLLEHQRWFYQSGQKEAAADPEKGYVFGASGDAARPLELVEMLRRHQIEVYKAAEAPSVQGRSISRENSYVVPLNQPQYRLIKAIFETRKTFTDSLFYDISAWTLPLAYNLPYQALDRRALGRLMGERIESVQMPAGSVSGGQSSYGYLLPWQPLYAPKALNQLLQKDLRMRVITEPVQQGGITFGRGSIWIPVQSQEITADSLYRLVSSAAAENNLQIHAVGSGNTGGVNLGSPSLLSVKQPRVMLAVGDGVSSYDAGEVWHLLDQRYSIQHSLVPMDKVRSADLSRYNVIILADGSYGSSADAVPALREWLRRGGTLIGLQGGARWMAQNGLSNAKYKKLENQDSLLGPQPYATLSQRRGAREMGGAIFQAAADTTHPLLWGYTTPNVSLFRTNTHVLEATTGLYAHPLRYTQNPVQAGYVWPGHLEHLKGTPAVQVSAYGTGRSIVLPDNPVFRAFWRGSERVLINAIFFGTLIDSRAAK